jgi:hypothetical protein
MAASLQLEPRISLGHHASNPHFLAGQQASGCRDCPVGVLDKAHEFRARDTDRATEAWVLIETYPSIDRKQDIIQVISLDLDLMHLFVTITFPPS